VVLFIYTAPCLNESALTMKAGVHPGAALCALAQRRAAA
jgi:hypothetical protein